MPDEILSDDAIDARMKAELAALDNRQPEVIPRDRRLDDPRLAGFQSQIRGAREHSLRAWAEKFDLPEKPAPIEHPLAAKLKVRLSDYQIGQIRERAAAGEKERDLADEFGVTKTHISMVVEGRIELPPEEMIGNVLAAERAVRPITAGLGLIHLQRRGHALPLPAEQADRLMGALLHRNGLLHCSGCGAEQLCLCGCGAPYWPEEVAKSDATEAVAKPVAKPFGGRPLIGDRPLTAAERMAKTRARRKALFAGTAPLPERKRGAVEDAEVDLDGRKIPAAEGAFILRASTACDLAIYEGAPVTEEVIASAEYAANAWKALALKLRQHRRKSHGEKQ